MRDLPPVLAIVQPNCELGIGDRDQHWQCDGFGPLEFIQDVSELRVLRCPVGVGDGPEQKPHHVRDGVAAILGIPESNVRAIWFVGPGSYGRNDSGDAAMDAAILANAIGRPVRVQYMREQGTGWDPKGPASIHRARAAIDASGKVIAYDFLSKAFSRLDVQTNESKPKDTLAGQFMGLPLQSDDAFGVPAESYEFDHKRLAWETIAPLLDRASPLRTAHLRDPVGPQIHFASESFMDELAAALNADPVEFRLRHVKNPRDIAVIKAAAERSGWQSRPSPRRDQSGAKMSGRGLAYAQRNGTRVAIVAEIDIDRPTGKISAHKLPPFARIETGGDKRAARPLPVFVLVGEKPGSPALGFHLGTLRHPLRLRGVEQVAHHLPPDRWVGIEKPVDHRASASHADEPISRSGNIACLYHSH